MFREHKSRQHLLFLTQEQVSKFEKSD